MINLEWADKHRLKVKAFLIRAWNNIVKADSEYMVQYQALNWIEINQIVYFPL